jgi:ABC transport system ATP-binding/permease protein
MRFPMAKSPTSVILTAHEISVSFAERNVLTGATLSIHQDDKVGLIGNNGCGKSTLLKVIAGLLPPDDGTVSLRRDTVVGYLSQDFQLDPSKNVYENILEGAHDVIDEIREYESLPYFAERRHVLENHILHRDGWNLENRIETAMHSLNVPDKGRDISTLSGGEKRRVALCKAIIARPDLLLLDEPTNHLDTESIEWIEQFMDSYPAACLFITHDRYFLDSIANKIIELSNGTCTTHAGNYSDFLIDKAEREAQLDSEEKKRDNFLRRELEWVRKGPRARRTKSKDRMARYFEMVSAPKLERDRDVELIIPPADQLGSTVLDFKNLSAERGGKKLFADLNLNFTRTRKLGVIGRNGLGKTSLLKIILGELSPSNGQVVLGERTRINYIDQTRATVDDEKTVLEEIGEGIEYIPFGDERVTVWRYLRRFLFADERMHTRVGSLSGGERSRLLLAKVLKNGGNFLILDEPTNDLDLATLRILEEALSEFNGCVIAVSHDRFFLNRICNGILAFEGDGKVHFSEGDYDYYVEKRRARLAARVASAPAAPGGTPRGKADAPARPKPAKLTWKENKELETIESDISRAEGEVEHIEGLFALPDFYARHGGEVQQLTDELARRKADVERLYARWNHLEEKRNQALTDT